MLMRIMTPLQEKIWTQNYLSFRFWSNDSVFTPLTAWNICTKSYNLLSAILIGMISVHAVIEPCISCKNLTITFESMKTQIS